jgi:hypothetical protein
MPMATVFILVEWRAIQIGMLCVKIILNGKVKK